MFSTDHEEFREFIKMMMGNRPECHGIQHVEQVEFLSYKLAKYYPGADTVILMAAALGHDLWDRKFEPDPEPIIEVFKEQLRKFMTSEQISKTMDAINTHSWSKGLHPNSIEGMIIQDADRITGIGATGILRAATYGSQFNRTFNETVDHLIIKCLKLRDQLNLPESKQMATEGHELLLSFVELYKKEVPSFES